jgi:3-oxoacyl-[acyl-carrier protein] reductase
MTGAMGVGHTAIVTGANHGIGAATARALARDGCAVLCAFLRTGDPPDPGTPQAYRDNRARDAGDVAAAIRAAGGAAAAVEADLSDPAVPARLFDAAEEHLGPVDILVNNAAIRPERDLAAVTPELWDEIFGINVKGPFFLTQRVLPGMIERRWGRVVNLGGLHGYIGSSHRTQVHASKQAVLGMTRGIAYEAAPYGVTANVVVPGRIATTRGPVETYGAQMDAGEAAKKVLMQRMGKPQEIASMVLYLASDQAAYISGQEMFVTGGVFPLVPGL